ncbi:MAG: phenylacetate-CoA oxygenase subunit PaaI, partial [Chloroflexi bacterium]|nr:phenylacetate-CoA oxygenase subunit PaaI [Chloroflexota bacterium]
MTDPATLEQLTGESTPAQEARNDLSLTEQERYDHFVAHVHAGGKVEPRDWMPEEYRTSVLRFVEMHANSELMGVLPEREWIMRAPTLKRKL